MHCAPFLRSMTVRRDNNARLVKVPGGCLTLGFGGSVSFTSGRVSATVNWKHEDLLQAQQISPIAVATDPRSRRTWWMFRDRFYWEEDRYSADQVKALVLAAEVRRRRNLERAIALTSRSVAEPSQGRAQIPEDVRIEVWRRDDGRCVKCGSQTNLEFDHIIPVSMGGSNTARNLQLLCESCNRSKGASLA